MRNYDSVLKFRGHHLVCLHFFSGEGYDTSFINNLRAILGRVEKEEIVVYNGADDVCGNCPYLKDGRCQYDKDADEKIRKMDEMALRLLKVDPNIRIKWQEVKKKIPEIFIGWQMNYCKDCDWKGVCEKNDFYQTLSTTRRETSSG